LSSSNVYCLRNISQQVIWIFIIYMSWRTLLTTGGRAAKLAGDKTPPTRLLYLQIGNVRTSIYVRARLSIHLDSTSRKDREREREKERERDVVCNVFRPSSFRHSSDGVERFEYVVFFFFIYFFLVFRSNERSPKTPKTFRGKKLQIIFEQSTFKRSVVVHGIHGHSAEYYAFSELFYNLFSWNSSAGPNAE